MRGSGGGSLLRPAVPGAAHCRLPLLHIHPPGVPHTCSSPELPHTPCPTPMQLKALLVFEPSEPPPLLGRAFRAGSASLGWDVSRLPSRTARAYIVSAIGLLWVGLGGALLLATELLSDATSLSVYYALAAACVTIGAFTTHGLAGFLRFSQGSSTSKGDGDAGGASAASGWRFWQPFRGGTAFVLAQVRIHWCLLLCCRL